MNKFNWHSFLLITVLAFPIAPKAQESDICDRPGGIAAESTINLRIDNDLFGGLDQDQGYTNGFLLTLVSPNLLHKSDDPCLPDVARQLNRVFSSLQPSGYDELNMTIGVGQMMYTPTDPEPRELIVDDRPYAGALLFSVGYNARRDNDLRSALLRFGVVGPAAKGGIVQNNFHDLIGVDRFNGWDNQLENEPVLQFIVERRRRILESRTDSPLGCDLIVHAGGSIGNFATYMNTGFEYRFGYHLPDDFGTAPLRPAGENTSPVKISSSKDWLSHLFVVFDTRWVLHDITLDGNTFRSSHSVHKRPLVADIGYGIAVTKSDWRLAFARYHRTREFDEQEKTPALGSITIGRRF